jgi:FAD/FMN-containing dehydrogenase
VNDGLVIDLSAMRGVRVDPAARTARAGAGCTQGDLNHATHAFGLAVPAGIRLAATFGDNLARLRAVKRKYDPKDLFRVNHNIKPATS